MNKRDFILRIVQFFWGSSLTKLGSSLAIIGAVALTGSQLQIIVAVYFASRGKPSPIPDIPYWIGFSIVFIGISVAILGAYWPRPGNAAAPNPHDIELLR